jgi:hypothetical protein
VKGRGRGEGEDDGRKSTSSFEPLRDHDPNHPNHPNPGGLGPLGGHGYEGGQYTRPNLGGPAGDGFAANFGTGASFE